MATSSAGLGKVLQIKQNLCKSKENAKQSEGTATEPIGEGSSLLWPDDDKKSPQWLPAVTGINTL